MIDGTNPEAAFQREKHRLRSASVVRIASTRLAGSSAVRLLRSQYARRAACDALLRTRFSRLGQELMPTLRLVFSPAHSAGNGRSPNQPPRKSDRAPPVRPYVERLLNP